MKMRQLSLSLPLKRCPLPEISVLCSFAGTIDYIWHTPQLGVRSLLDLPSFKQVTLSPVPSTVFAIVVFSRGRGKKKTTATAQTHSSNELLCPVFVSIFSLTNWETKQGFTLYISHSRLAYFPPRRDVLERPLSRRNFERPKRAPSRLFLRASFPPTVGSDECTAVLL